MQRVRIATIKLDLEPESVGRANLNLFPYFLAVVQPVGLRIGVRVLQAKVVGLDGQIDVITNMLNQFVANGLLLEIHRQVGAVQQEHLAVQRVLGQLELLLLRFQAVFEWLRSIAPSETFGKESKHCEMSEGDDKQSNQCNQEECHRVSRGRLGVCHRS